MRVLLHICCAPCSIYPLAVLRGEGHDARGLFHNPNIHPYQEFRKRLDTLLAYARLERLALTVDEDYPLEAFLQHVAPLGSDRCLYCYRSRLHRAVLAALADHCDAFTTTLLYSRYQKHEQIRAIGEELAREHGIPFLYRDFREGWAEGVRRSRDLDMYRQPYCGCIYSEKERYFRRRLSADPAGGGGGDEPGSGPGRHGVPRGS